MTVLGISGTPRKNGNSEILLSAAFKPFESAGWDICKVLLSQMDIAPCSGCETCIERRSCSIRDDMAYIYDAYEKCDAVIISSPTYWRNVPAQLKAVFDRTFALNHKKPLMGKLGGAIAVGRGSGAGQSIVLNVIHNFYLSSGALCVPGELNGVTAVADKPGDISEQPRRLRQAEILGENILKYMDIYHRSA
ncbi:MAG: flavodoxin family protein [Oscillospiraceae bacterium]|jgi:multimeric flavodoxin WrbA|nr:flavodoxin family protein [Oscillospiraceae bacterium]